MSKKNSRNTSKKNSRNTSKKNSRNTSKKNSRNTSKKNSRNTSKKNLRNTSKKNLRNTSKKNLRKNIKRLNCSPKKDHDFTCYSSNSLNKIKDLWNKRHPDSKITTNNLKEIWNALQFNLSNTCDTEKCWLNQKFMENNLNSELKNFTFAPSAPKTWKKNPNEWLNSVDINKVMKQYEHVHPSFVFIGPSPIDFNKKKLFGQCVWNELCNFNLKSYIDRGKDKIGIIFNTDPHYLGGSHWICMFIDINKKYIFYFDSNADSVPKQITKFRKEVQKQAKKLNINLKYYKNTTEHQKTNTECGIYVLFVISKLLENKMTPEMFKARVPDKDMEHLRTVFFN